MATGGATRGVNTKNTYNLTYQELVPSSVWTEDANCHCLLIDLPGFKKDQLRLQVDNNGNVIASGERKTENKCIHFQQAYKVPDNSKIGETTAKFEDEILYVLIPKQVTTKTAENNQMGTTNINQQQNADIARKQDGEINEDDQENGLCCDHITRDEKELFHDNAAATQRKRKTGVLETVREKLKAKKGIIVTALLAFSLGVLVSHNLQSQSE